jgi:hypothetical protein
VSATLHLPRVDRWAEQLGARELLPGLDHEINALDAALLLAAVVAAPRPADAPRVVATLADLPLVFVERRVGSVKSPTWAPGTDDDIEAMFGDPLEILAAAIEEAPDPEGQLLFGSLKIEESGLSAEFHGCLGADYREYRAGYALAGLGLPSGITRFVEVHGDVIRAIAGAMWPPAEHVVSHDESTLTIH